MASLLHYWTFLVRYWIFRQNPATAYWVFLLACHNENCWPHPASLDGYTRSPFTTHVCELFLWFFAHC